MLLKSKRDKISFQKNVIMFFILFFTCNNLFSEKITDYVNKKDVQNVNKIFIYREEKRQKKEETEKDTKETLEENDYQEEDNYEKEEDDIDFVLPPFFEE